MVLAVLNLHVLVSQVWLYLTAGISCNLNTSASSGSYFQPMCYRWRETRSKLTPGFTSGKLKLMYPLIHDVCKDLLEHLKEDKGEGKENELVTVLNKIRKSKELFLQRSSHGQPTKGGPPAWWLGAWVTTPHRKNKLVKKCRKG